MYHRFPTDFKLLREQCRHIREHYEPVSINQIADWLDGDMQLPENALAITIDDGYRDFLDRAHPIFREFDLPTTVYLVSDFLDGKCWLWWNQIEYAFQESRVPPKKVKLPFNNIAVKLDSPGDRFQTARMVAESLTAVDDAIRSEFLDRLPSMLEVDFPAAPPDELAPLTWNEVRELSREGVTFGCHTRTHPILSRLKNAGEQEREIRDSKERLEQELAAPVDHFCYPNGSLADFDESTLKIVSELKFRTAVTTESGINFMGAQRYQLKRLPVDPTLPQKYFERLLAGATR